MFVVAATVLNRRISIYLFAYLVIQMMILFTTFEFIRKPWEGKELEIERITQLIDNNLFDSISAYTDIDKDNQDVGGTFTNDGANAINKKNQQEKVAILQSAYQCPFEAFFVE